MARNVIVITVDGNQYKVEKNGISDFTLIGVLECLISDLKSNRHHPIPGAGTAEFPAAGVSMDVSVDEKPSGERAGQMDDEKSAALEAEAARIGDIGNRIINARKAIRELGGEVDETDLSAMTAEELQSEFEELAGQYKRLKNSRSAAKPARK